MSTPAPEAAPLDDRALTAHLRAFRANPDLWRTDAGRQVLAEARRRFARLSLASGLDESDGATHAWEFWVNDLTDADLDAQRDTLWRFTGAVIRRTMRTEDMAQSRLVSARALRQVEVVGMAAPVRYQSAAELIELGVDERAAGFDDDTDLAPVRPIGERTAITLVRQLLVMAGLTAAQRDEVFDTVARLTTTSTTLAAAARALTATNAPVAAALGAERWQALVSLMVGTAAGAPGLIRLAGEGHPSPMREPHITRLVDRFLTGHARVAAGVA